MRSTTLILITILFLLYNKNTAHRCVHDEILQSPQFKNQQKSIEVAQNHAAQYVCPTNNFKPRIDSSSFFTQPMSIYLDLTNLDDDEYTCYKEGDSLQTYRTNKNFKCRAGDVLTFDKRKMLEVLLYAAKQFFEETLLVRPLGGPLIIDSSLDKQSYCDDVRINPSYEFNGIPNATYVVFVTSRPTDSDTTLAYARYCQTDNICPGCAEGRPTVGIVNFAPYSIDLTDEGMARQLGVVIHELTHALGFTISKFEGLGFIEWTNFTECRRVPPSKIVKSYYHPVIGHEVKRIITPNVVKAARDHYNCSGLDGAELEDGGGVSTSGSHWEQRVFMNEFMTGTSTPYPVYSKITFALFKDMGWYGVNDERLKTLDPFLWGRNMGCQFVNGSCHEWPLTSEAEGYRCDSNSPRGQCRFDLRGWAECNVNQPDPLDDGCRFYKSTIRTDCALDTKFFQMSLYAGEEHGNTSRCFHSTTAKLPGIMSSYLRAPQAPIMQCYATTCSSPTQLKLGIDGVWYDCPYEGGSIYPIDFGGEITCRPHAADIACVGFDQDDDWPIVSRVHPRKANPGDVITIMGLNFDKTNNTSVIVNAECEILSINDTDLIVQLPSNDKFSSLRSLGIFSKRFSVIVKDSKGRTSHAKDVIWIQTDINGEDITAYLGSVGIPIIASQAVAGLILVITICISIFCCYLKCKNIEQEKAGKTIEVSL